METGLPALCRAPGPIQGPYGCLIEHTALLIELTALSLGPFPLPQRRGTIPHPHGTPVPSHRRQGSGRGRREVEVERGGLVAGESKGSEEGVVETVQKTCPFLLANPGWKCELGATKGLSLHRTGEFQQDREWKDGIVGSKHNISLQYNSTSLTSECSCGTCNFLTIC